MTTATRVSSRARRNSLGRLSFFAVLASGITGAAAQAPNLVNNGAFESVGSLNGTNSVIAPAVTGTNATTPVASTLPNWLVTQPSGQSGYISCVVLNGVNNMCGTSYGAPHNTYATFALFPGKSPDGGNFLAADADPAYSETISQTIAGLTAGAKYTLTFYQAGAQQSYFFGDTTDQWVVTFGTGPGSTQSSTLMSVKSQGIVAWMQQTMTFTATAASQTLSFLASGGPAGDPPMALLDGVSLTQVQVPEPGSLAILAVAGAGLAALRRQRVRR